MTVTVRVTLAVLTNNIRITKLEKFPLPSSTFAPVVVQGINGDGVRHSRLQWNTAAGLSLLQNSDGDLWGDSIVKDFVAISAAAIAGANLRYLFNRLALRGLGPVFPYGTLFINIMGSLIVGFFVIWTTQRVLVDPRWSLMVVVVFWGSFTTFSSYAFETMAYFEQGQWG
jgi:CrcB protein